METLVASEFMKAYGPPVAALFFIAYYLFRLRQDNAKRPPPVDIYAIVQAQRDELAETRKSVRETHDNVLWIRGYLEARK